MRTSSWPVLLGLLAFGCAHTAAPSTPPAPSGPPAFTVRVSGAGRPVLFIPDLAAPGEMWDSTVAHFGGRVQAHVVEVAGFAGNPPAGDHVLPTLRDGLARYIREHKLKGTVVVGELFGATVAYWLAMTEPDLIGGIVVIDTPPSRGEGKPDEEVEEHHKELSQAPPEKFAKMMRFRLATTMADKELAKRFGDKVALSSQKVVAEAFYDMMTLDLRSQIGNIRAPVLAFLTTENFPPPMRPVIEGAFREQMKPIAHQELVVVKGAHHHVASDAPEAFFGGLDRFLAAHP